MLCIQYIQRYWKLIFIIHWTFFISIYSILFCVLFFLPIDIYIFLFILMICLQIRIFIYRYTPIYVEYVELNSLFCCFKYTVVYCKCVWSTCNTISIACCVSEYPLRLLHKFSIKSYLLSSALHFAFYSPHTFFFLLYYLHKALWLLLMMCMY